MIYTGHIDKCHVVLCDPNDDIEKFNQHAKENGIETLKKYVPLDVDKNTHKKLKNAQSFSLEYKSKARVIRWKTPKICGEPTKPQIR